MAIKEYFEKRKKFNEIAKDIKEIKIQGARNIAKRGLDAYYLIPNKSSYKKLIKLRPTEPMLVNVLNMARKNKPKQKILDHFERAQDSINKKVYRIIKKDDVIFTHCHSTNVINGLIYSKKKNKKFQVYHTETRPLFQGRKTAMELKRAKIKSTMFVDSGINIALSKTKNTKKATKVFLGADAITKQGIINKIGSGIIAELSKSKKIPIYIVADSWKYTKKKVPIETRKLNEVWDKAPDNIKIQNPAFEFVDKKYIKYIVSDLGILTFKKFLKEVEKGN